jgi:hypothetical protein
MIIWRKERNDAMCRKYVKERAHRLMMNPEENMERSIRLGGREQGIR